MDKIEPKNINELRMCSALNFFSPNNKELTKLMLKMKKYQKQIEDQFVIDYTKSILIISPKKRTQRKNKNNKTK